jgi:excisionase family DNA binding protein
MRREPEYTTAEVAAELGLTPQTIRDNAERGKFPGAYRPGGNGHWRIPQSGWRRFEEVDDIRHV